MKFPKISKKNRQIVMWSAGAVGASLIAVGTALFVILQHSGRNDPATILPARETIALVRNADTEVMERLNAYVTGFDAIPLPDHPVDVALLLLPDGDRAWAIFDASTAPLGTRFSITASDTAAQALIGEKGNVLADDRSYADLQSFLPENASGAYLKFPAVTLNRDIAATSLVSLDSPAVLVFEHTRTRFALPMAQDMDWTTNQVPAAFDDPSVVLAADDASSLLDETSSLLSPQPRALLESAVRTSLVTLFGKEISPAFDLLPLVRTSFSAQLKTGASTRIVVAGQADSAQTAKETVTRMHEAFASNLPGVETLSRALDDKFSYTGIRRTDDTAVHSSRQLNGYSVEKSMRRSGSGMFLTAVRGSSVLLSNDEASLTRALSSPWQPVADGSVVSLAANRADLAQLWKTFLPQVPSVLEPGNSPVQWSAKREGGALVLDIPR